ncbi:hypothetical protein JSCD14_08270 [Clostridioides difficile]|uniref:Uncharacterized protein n=1 Tax=Clostridioides difficile NAP08 TaxID=525259 RepID=D5Q217_CLODI|nr:hypothetical protein HMPREF0220_0949 [Clostridioides difficile NAP08]EFH16459.1 hypothetical protein HMPREF0219_0853 [Clostridioides difficile NAP07]CCK88006.1 conserved hypothetical protein [Clostridioides difficile T5]CCK91446.1 conserved hypothetical protein [Clostridioides difficile T20]CCK95144.1 conserved hypothetical protein [Clostridioides difficile E1]CCK99090.1 conserved hypothetical protein [Clostridioides difficile E10]GCA60149.1 hypothetical protein TNHP173_17950 [Clostridioid
MKTIEQKMKEFLSVNEINIAGLYFSILRILTSKSKYNLIRLDV